MVGAIGPLEVEGVDHIEGVGAEEIEGDPRRSIDVEVVGSEEIEGLPRTSIGIEGIGAEEVGGVRTKSHVGRFRVDKGIYFIIVGPGLHVGILVLFLFNQVQ